MATSLEQALHDAAIAYARSGSATTTASTRQVSRKTVDYGNDVIWYPNTGGAGGTIVLDATDKTGLPTDASKLNGMSITGKGLPANGTPMSQARYGSSNPSSMVKCLFVTIGVNPTSGPDRGQSYMISAPLTGGRRRRMSKRRSSRRN